MQAQDLGRQLPQGWIWRHVSFALEPGDRLAVVGPSGSGKTLLLRTLGGLDAADEGAIACLGRPLDAWAMPAYRATVLYMHQSAALFEGSVAHNLQLPFTLRAHRAPFPRERALRFLAAFGRDEAFFEQPQAGLSGGERQMVSLVRALLLAPRVLLLDEATSAMDPDSTAIAERLVDDWLAAEPSRACLWVSHDTAQRARIATRELPLGAA